MHLILFIKIIGGIINMIKLYFMDRNILLWLSGSTLSAFGDVFTSTAIPLVTFNLTKSARFSALVLLLDILPLIILSPLIGTIVDKCEKKKIIIISNLISVLILGSFLIINNNEWYYLIGNSLISISAKFYSTSAKTMLPDIVNDEGVITRVNSLISLTLKIARILGASLAAIVLGLWGTKILFMFDAVSFIINMLCVFGLRLGSEQITEHQNIEKHQYVFMDAVKYFSKDNLFLIMCIVYGGLFFLEGLMQSQMVVFIKQYLLLDDMYYAFYQNCLLVGVVVGQIVLSRYEMVQKEFFWEKVGMGLIVVSLVGIFVFKNIWFGVLYGFGQPLIVTSWYGYFYKHTPGELRGRLLAFTNMCFDSLHLLAVVVVYFICDYFMPQQSLLFTAMVLTIVLLATSIIRKNKVE